MPNFFFSVIAIIVGVALYKQFDFQTLKFDNTGLAVVYAITFAGSAFLLIKDLKKTNKADS